MGNTITYINLFVSKSGHPIFIISGAVDLIGIILVWILIKTGNSKYCTRLVFPYFVYHTVSAVCVYKEWLPAYFNGYPKDNMSYLIVLVFIIVNAVPLIDYKLTLFFMFPVLLAGSVIQKQVESRELAEQYAALPPSFASQFKKQDENIFSQSANVLFIGIIFVYAHYL